MPSVLFPDAGSRRAEDTAGRPAVSKTAVVYADVAGATLAEIYADSSGTPGALIADGRLTTDAYGFLPLFWGPTAGTDKLYVSVNGGPVWPVNADYDARVDALAARVVTLEAGGGGGGSAELDTHVADATTVHGIVDTAALETTVGATAKVTAHAAASDPHGDRAHTAAAVATHAAVTAGVHGIADTALLETTAGAQTKANTAAAVVAAAALQRNVNLADLTDAVEARENLALGDSATKNVGTTIDTVAAGNDSRITGAAQKAANLSDLASAATARTNLSLGNVDNTSDANKPVSTAQATAIAAKVAKGDQVFNVKDYGAVSGGSTATNGTAFTNGLAAAVAAGGGIVYVPPGDFNIGATTLTLNNNKNITVEGAGYQSSIVRCSGQFLAASNNSDQCRIAGLQIVCTTATNTTSGIVVDYPRRWLIERCRIDGFGGDSIRYQGGIHSAIRWCYILAKDTSNTNGNAGINIEESLAAVVATTITTERNYVGTGKTYGYRWFKATNSMSIGDIVELIIPGVGMRIHQSGVTVYDLYTEGNSTHFEIFDSPITIVGSLRNEPAVTWTNVAAADRYITRIGRNWVGAGRGLVFGGTTAGTDPTTFPSVRSGTGSPEGVQTAVVGSVWLRADGGASTTMYAKESGTGNTGWVAVGSSPGTPTAHAASHAPGGSDPLAGLTATNFAAASVDGVAGTASLRSLGTGAQQAAAGNDTRITGAIQASTVDAKGDLLAGTADNTMARVAVGADGYALVADSAVASGVAWKPRTPDVQTFTSSGTWTKPSGAVLVEVVCFGGGGGGGSGRRGAAATVRCAGGAGAGAGMSRAAIPAAALASTVAVTVGSGGTGGAAVAVDDTNGNAGGAATQSSFGSHLRGGVATGASGGSGGTATSGTAGTGSIGNAGTGGNGGAASTSGGVGAAGATTGTAASGAGAGGGITSGDVAGAGGNGGSTLVASLSVAAGGVVGGAGPTGGATQGAGANLPGYGGGGGAASTSGAAQAGADGGLYGGGGGGGGASVNGNPSGAGGNGAPGVVQVTTYF